MHSLTGRLMRSMIPRGLVSTRLWQWYPLQRCHRVRPKYRCALIGSLRAIVPALVDFQSYAFLRGGITDLNDAFTAIVAGHKQRSSAGELSGSLSCTTLGDYTSAFMHRRKVHKRKFVCKEVEFASSVPHSWAQSF